MKSRTANALRHWALGSNHLEDFLRLMHLHLTLLTALGLAACTTAPTTEQPNANSSSVEGTLGTGLETDVELFHQPGNLQIQAQVTPTFAFAGTYVVAINITGNVLGSSEIDAKGAFKLLVPKDNTVALALASKGTSGWICQQTLEYRQDAGTRTAALKVGSSAINAGNFRFNPITGNPSSVAGNAATQLEAFDDDGLSGFMRCGNPKIAESTVSLDYDLSANKITDAGAITAFATDDARLYQNLVVFGLDTTQATPKWIAAARVRSDGKVNMRVRHERDSDVMLSPTITDTREPSSGGLMLPTWNGGLPSTNIVGGEALGKITRNLIKLEGDVRNDTDAKLEGIRVGARNRSDTVGLSTLALKASATDPVRIARNRAVTAADGTYTMLVPAPDQTSDWALKAQGIGCNAEENATLAVNDTNILNTGQKRIPTIYLGACQAATSSGVRVLEVTTDLLPDATAIGGFKGSSLAQYLSGGDKKAPVFANGRAAYASFDPNYAQVSSTFTINNPSNGERFDNLSLYAASIAPGSSLTTAGLAQTAINALALTGSTNPTLDANAALSLTPVHARANITAINAANFQAFTPDEILRVQTIIKQSGLNAQVRLLDYGFVAQSEPSNYQYVRNLEPGSNNASNITLSWRVPKAWLNGNSKSLHLKTTFVVANQPDGLVSQDMIETPFDVIEACRRAQRTGLSNVIVMGRPVTAPLTIPGCTLTNVPEPRLSAANDPLTPGNLQFGNGGSDEALAVTSDSKGNLIVVGNTTGVFGSVFKGGTDYWIAKFPPNSSQPTWVVQDGTAGAEGFTAVAVDANDNIYAVGRSDTAPLVVKFAPNGMVLATSALEHTRTLNPSGLEPTSLTSVVVIGNAVYVGGDVLQVMFSPANSNAALFKLDANLNDLWKWQYTGASSSLRGLAANDLGELYGVISSGRGLIIGSVAKFGSNLTSAPSAPILTLLGVPSNPNVSYNAYILPSSIAAIPTADKAQYGEVLVGGQFKNASFNTATPVAGDLYYQGFAVNYRLDAANTFVPISATKVSAPDKTSSDTQVTAVGVLKNVSYSYPVGSLKFIWTGVVTSGIQKHGFVQAKDEWTRELGSGNDAAHGLTVQTRAGVTDRVVVAGWTQGALAPYLNRGLNDAVLSSFTPNGY
jgi:hypothetical protein